MVKSSSAQSTRKMMTYRNGRSPATIRYLAISYAGWIMGVYVLALGGPRLKCSVKLLQQHVFTNLEALALPAPMAYNTPLLRL
jgi:hypothetical protein